VGVVLTVAQAEIRRMARAGANNLKRIRQIRRLTVR